MATHPARVYSRKNTRWQWVPSPNVMISIGTGVLNLLYMLIYLPAGLQSVARYPLNLGMIALVNASVMFILWIDKRSYGRSITYGFILPLVFVILTGSRLA